jgi:acetolactate decarboxylase
LEQVEKEIALVKTQFNQITAENDMKWEKIHQREGPGGYDFGPADSVVKFGEMNGFRQVEVRSMSAQSKPHKVMAELVKTQPTFEFNDVAGTMIGFWSPASMQGIGLAGLHLHFFTKDEHGKGHMLEFTASDAVLKLDKTLEMAWHISGLQNYKNTPMAGKP